MMMTKAQEIAALRNFIANMGESSYLGAWLSEQLPEVERCLLSDFIPDASFEAYHSRRFQETEHEMETLRLTRMASIMEDQAAIALRNKLSGEFRDTVISELRQAIKQIEAL